MLHMSIQLQKSKEINEEERAHMQKLLMILSNKMKYDASYDFDKPDQIEQEFLEYRKVSYNIIDYSIASIHFYPNEFSCSTVSEWLI